MAKKHVSEQYHSSMSMLTMVAVVAIVAMIVMGAVVKFVLENGGTSLGSPAFNLAGGAARMTDASTGASGASSVRSPASTSATGAVSCLDNDGGDKPLARGTTTLYTGSSAGRIVFQKQTKDACIGNNRLVESYCENNAVKTKNYDCARLMISNKLYTNKYVCRADSYGTGYCAEILPKAPVPIPVAS